MKGIAFALSTLLAGSSVTASAASNQSDVQPPAGLRELAELDEVLISGEKPSKKVAELIPWLRRLVGGFRVEARISVTPVDSEGQDIPTAGGSAVCLGFGPAPGVECQIDLRWSKGMAAGQSQLGESADFLPIAMLFGIEPDRPGIRFMLVNSAGIAEPGDGPLVGDTLTTRELCVNPEGSCERVTRIAADPDGKAVSIRIDIQVEYRRVAGALFVMRRESVAPPDAAAGVQR